MNEHVKRIQKPRCFLLYALAPAGMSAADANRVLNDFIGQPGGLVIFFVQSSQERDALLDQKHLEGWHVEIQPLIYSHSPAAFDSQAAFTLQAYRGLDWEMLQREKRPAYGNPNREAETAQEEE